MLASKATFIWNNSFVAWLLAPYLLQTQYKKYTSLREGEAIGFGAQYLWIASSLLAKTTLSQLSIKHNLPVSQ